MLSTNTHQSQPSTSFYRNKVTLLKKSLKQTYYRSKLKTVEMMLKKHGKLLMNLFLQNLKKTKQGEKRTMLTLPLERQLFLHT